MRRLQVLIGYVLLVLGMCLIPTLCLGFFMLLILAIRDVALMFNGTIDVSFIALATFICTLIFREILVIVALFVSLFMMFFGASLIQD